MDFIIANGMDWVIAIQSLGAWLELPMRFLSFLGSENFFFLVLPLIYWSIDAKLGLQVGLILAASNCLKPMLKIAFAGPRPYWVSEQVRVFAAEGSFGVPSGHAQDAAALWGVMAYGTRKQWAWMAAIALVFLIGFSRVYLGVHFVYDVIAGWLVGALILWIFTRLWDSAAAWIQTRSMGQQIFMAFAISMLVIVVGALLVARLHGFVIPAEWMENARRAGADIDPISMEGFITPAGSLFGLAAGAAWIASRGGFQASGPLEKRAFRYAIGLIGILVLWMGLGEVFPRDENMISYVLRYFRYTLVGFWVTAGAPWLFFHFKLADKPKI